VTVTPVDLRGYVDLTLYDRNPGSLVERALNDAVAKLPGWVPREGLTEMVLIEAMALEVAELVYAINRVPGAVAETLFRLFDVTRDPGGAATMTVEFTFVDNTGRTVPAGSRLRLAAGGQQWLFVLDDDATAAPGNLTAAATATAARLSAVPNGAPIGTVVELLDLHYYVEGAAVTVAPAGGRDAETTAAWLTRATARLARLTDALVLPAHFVAAALDNPLVKRAQTLDQYDPTVGPAPGSNPGHVTVAVAGPAGALLTAPQKTDLEATLEALALVNLDVHIIDATITNVAVTTDVTARAGFTAAQVQANVTAALGAYLDPDVWPWAGTVYRNELIALIDSTAGVDRVVSLTAPAADVILAGFAPLANDGVIVVNVV
jgi:hypothetical protein